MRILKYTIFGIQFTLKYWSENSLTLLVQWTKDNRIAEMNDFWSNCWLD